LAAQRFTRSLETRCFASSGVMVQTVTFRWFKTVKVFYK
jgi:hypothetical protein